MGNIFNDSRLMQMAGMAVMGGKPLGEAMMESSKLIAEEDYKQAQMQRQQYEMQQQQQQQMQF